MTRSGIPKRRKLISINDYGKTVKDLSRLGNDIQAILKPYIFEISTVQQLRFEALRLIKPFNQNLKNNPSSINRKVEEVLNYLGMIGKKVKVSTLLDDGKEEVLPVNDPSNIEMFELYILGFDKLPANQLKLLKLKVEEHLRYANQLIKEYESMDLIIAYMEGGNQPRNHESKTILDFYKRALNERQLIIDYYLDGVYERALRNSRTRDKFMSSLNFDLFAFMDDFPYELGKGLYGRSLDFRKINCAQHRVGEFHLQEARTMISKYHFDKEDFYRRFFKLKSKDKIFQSIEYNLSYLPLVNDRTETFKELKRLFSSKKWLAFYALALPQVEGLFSRWFVQQTPHRLSFLKRFLKK